MKGIRRVITVFLCATFLLGFTACKDNNKAQPMLDKKNPTTVTIWHYYNGTQKNIFDSFVKQFNETIGADEGIVVTAQAHGSVSELTQKVLASMNVEYGAEKMPAMFAAYTDTAFEVNDRGLAVDLNKYFTKDELDQYVSSYLDEGYFDESKKLILFPTAKTTEVLLINKTDWEKFKNAEKVSEDDLKTWESITALAKKYYEYSGGKAFFGRDAFANYMIIGSLELGTELFKSKNGRVTFQVDRDIMKKLWDNYYVPTVNGWFGSYGRFRSDDIKTGEIIAMVGSTSSVTYFPSEVTRDDGSTYPIDYQVFKLPCFEGCDPVAVQQGAGMLITKTDEKTQYAAAQFLKWFTNEQQNVGFSVMSGYMSVKKQTNTQQEFERFITEYSSDIKPIVKDTLTIGMDMTKTYRMYINKAFKNGTQARDVVDTSMHELATNDLEKINELCDGGMDRQQAISQFANDEHFEQWLAKFTQALKQTQN